MLSIQEMISQFMNVLEMSGLTGPESVTTVVAVNML